MSDQVKSITLPVKGMTCAACAASVEKALNEENTVNSAQVNFATNTVQLDITNTASIKQLAKKVKSRGYELVTQNDTSGSSEHNNLRQVRSQLMIALPITVVVVVLSMFVGAFDFKNYLLFGLTLLVLIIGGRRFYASAWKQLKHRSANMDTLIALGTGSAFLFSSLNTFLPDLIVSGGGLQLIYFESAAVIIGFILLGKYLEELSKFKTSNAISSLYDLAVKHVDCVAENGELIQTDIEQIQIGDTLSVKTGQKIPVDGLVVFGSGSVDESFLTGESIPIEKETESKVLAGTVLMNGRIHVKTESKGSDTKLNQVIQLVQQAMGSKASAQKVADKIAGVFVPAVLLIAIITGLTWYFTNSNEISLAFINTFNVLIIACPCALGLATPMAIMVGVGKAARSGVLVKDAEALLVAKDIKRLFLDKTGTISEGNLSVTSEVLFFSDEQKLELLSILFSMESSSVHPIANAITEHLQKTYSLFPFPVMNIKTNAGIGLEAEIADSIYHITPLDYDVASLSKVQKAQIKEVQESGGAGALFLKDQELLAIYGLTDSVKSGFGDLVKEFDRLGLGLEILSGDNEAAVALVAYEAGISNYEARLLPEQKAEIVGKAMMTEKVAFAGDGINDSPALAMADLGIAMGTGTDAAMNTAGVTIASGKMERILELFKLSKSTNRIMRQNLFWAFVYNVLAIPVAAGLLYPITGYLMDPMLAGFAMAISSVSVVLNSLRLNWV